LSEFDAPMIAPRDSQREFVKRFTDTPERDEEDRHDRN
jgi:hypothetical protein